MCSPPVAHPRILPPEEDPQAIHPEGPRVEPPDVGHPWVPIV
jgi:hypothetical protein